MGLTPMSIDVTMLVIGGLGTVIGPIIGTAVVTVIQTILIDYPGWQLTVLGVALLIIVIFVPGGIVGLICASRAASAPGSPRTRAVTAPPPRRRPGPEQATLAARAKGADPVTLSASTSAARSPMPCWSARRAPDDREGATRPGDRSRAASSTRCRRCSSRAGRVPGDVGYLAHGTTVATNAIVQRRLARTALLTNEGFPDVLAIGTQMRTPSTTCGRRSPARRRRASRLHRAAGASTRRGDELEPLDEAELRRRRRKLRDAGLEAIAVMFLLSFLNDAARAAGGGDPGRGAARRRDLALLARRARVPRVRARLHDCAQRSLLPLVGDYIEAVGSEIAAAGVPCRCT